MSVLNEIGKMLGTIDAYYLAKNLARRIQQGEYWEDVAIEMQDMHPNIAWEDIEKVFVDFEGVDPAAYAADADEEDEGWTDPAGGYHPAGEKDPRSQYE